MSVPVAASSLSPAQAVRQARIVALAILAGQVIFLAVAAFMVSNAQRAADAAVAAGAEGASPPAPVAGSNTLLAVALFLFAVLVPIAFLLRRRLLTPGDGGTVAPDLYVKGQIVFFGLCEMPTLMFLVVALFQQELMPAGILAVMTIAVQALNLPKPDDLGGA